MGEVEQAVSVLVIGFGATAFMDVFIWIQHRLFNVPGLNYALVGRWIIGFRRGKFKHSSILQSPSVPFERSVGWVAHYAIGVLIVGGPLMIWDSKWLTNPGFVQAVSIGLASVLAPFLIMQPGLGFGWAGSKTAHPWLTRKRSVVAHLSFGVGIYFAGLAWGLIAHLIDF